MSDGDLVERSVIAFRCERALAAAAERVAAAEGISLSDVARRALLRDLRASEDLPAAGG
jgi:hypothetical protein